MITAKITCAACDIIFPVEETLITKRRKDGKTFYCPKGHSNFFPQGITDLEKANESIKYLKEKRDYYRNRVERLEKELNAIKGWKTRYKIQAEDLKARLDAMGGLKK